MMMLWGRCWEGEGSPSFWPWVQILRAAVRAREPKVLADEMGPRAPEIAEIVPEVREKLSTLPAASALRFFEQNEVETAQVEDLARIE